jgi:hypothetical protein
MFDEMVPFYICWNLKSANVLTQVKFVFTSAAPRSIAVSFPFHTTMVDDGTQQHHEHLLAYVAIQAIHGSYIYNKVFRDVSSS